MNSHRVAAVAVIAIAVALFGVTFGFESMPEGITRGFGAEVFPRLVLGTIIAMALLLLIGSPAGEPLPPIPAMVWWSGGALLVFMALVPLIGMLPAMFLFLVGVGYLWGERRRLVLLVSAMLLTAVIWAVFVKGFGVQLPRSLLS